MPYKATDTVFAI